MNVFSLYSVNVFVRDLDIAIPGVMDNRRLEVVADGLPLFHGAQLAVDTTMVSPLKRDGSACPRSATVRCPGESEAEEGSDVSRIGRTIWSLPLGCVGL